MLYFLLTSLIISLIFLFYFKVESLKQINLNNITNCRAECENKILAHQQLFQKEISEWKDIYQDKVYKLEKELSDTVLEKVKIVNEIPDLISKAREQSVKTSHAVIKGHVAENMAPFLPEFPYKSSEMRVLLNPVDYIVFQGMDNDTIESICLLDIKSGGAVLSKRQKQIRDVINSGKVKFDVFRIE